MFVAKISPIPATSDDHAARVAAEVAARYGLTVDPAVVQRVAPGVSGLPQPVWDGRALVYEPQSAGRKPWVRLPQRRRGRQGLVDPAVAERRQAVAALHAQGLSDAQISEKLGISTGTIYGDRRVLGLRANYKPDTGPRTVTQVRIDRMRVMLAERKGRAEIMAELGIDARLMRRLAQMGGLDLPIRKRSDAAGVEARAARIAQMIAEGHSRQEIQEAIGVSRNQLRMIATRAGLVLPDHHFVAVTEKAPRPIPAPKPFKAKPVPAYVLRRARLREMDLADLTVSEIAARMGEPVEHIREDLKALKITPKKAPPGSDSRARQARLQALRELDLTGVSVPMLVERFGVSAIQLRRDLQQIGRKAACINGMHQRGRELREKIRVLAIAGTPRRDIEARLGIRSSCLRQHLLALGITIARDDSRRVVTKGEQNTKDMQALRLRIHALRAAGRTIEQIAAAVSRSNGTVCYHLSKPPVGQGAA